MPIFSTKYDTKTIPARAKRQNINYPLIHEEPNDLSKISLTLNKTTLKFVDGQWSGSGSGSQPHNNVNHRTADKDAAAIKKKLRRMDEENNLQQLKIDILLDMLTENMNELNVFKKPQ